VVSIYIEAGGKRCKLPINPEIFQVQREGDNQVESVVGIGETTITQPPKLRVFPISGEFPRWEDYATNAKGKDFYTISWYKSFFEQWQDGQQPGRLICADYGVNLPVTIEGFSYEHQGGTDDVEYSMTLKEYRPRTVQQINIKQTTTSSGTAKTTASTAASTPRSNTSGKITKGATVLVSGTLYLTSVKTGAGKTLKNYKGKINLIVNGAKCPYHVTSPSGGYLGWVEAKAVKLA
jgi:hypothetical protein